MTEPPGATTILIADDDVGFIWWLGEIFNELGYRSLPALNCPEALSIVKKTGLVVDILLINPHLRGASKLIETLRRVRPPKVVLIQEADAVEIPALESVTTLERPSGWEPVSRSEWRQKVQQLLRRLGSGDPS